MTSAEASLAFGNANSGLQVGQSFASISAEFHLPPERAETPPLPCSTVPLLRDPNYVSRKTLLDEVKKKASVPRARVAVVGLGGTGKTQLAVEYADSVHTRSPDTWIIWISAHNAARVQQSVKDVADRLKIRGRSDPSKDLLELLNQWLGDKSKGKWLAILDNFDDVDVSASSRTNTEGRRRLTDYFPVCDHGLVVITTRSKMVAYQLVYEEFFIVVEPMNAQHATKLLEKKLGADGRYEYERLAAALDFIPLAMSQAASYIRKRGCRSSVEHYLRKIEKNRQSRTELLRRGADLPNHDSDASRSVMTTWQISFEHMHQERRSAADLLALMSMCDRQAIPKSLLRATGCEDRAERSRNDDEEANDSDEGFEANIEMLRDFSFISTTASDTDWTMHRLVQDATRAWIEQQGRSDDFRQSFIWKLDAIFPSGMPETWQTCHRLFPHVQCAAELDFTTRSALLRWARITRRAGIYRWTMADFDQAGHMAAESTRINLKYLGKGHRETMGSQCISAYVLLDQLRYREAENVLLELLEMSEARYGTTAICARNVKHTLATAYSEQRCFKKAEALLLELIESEPAMLEMDLFRSLASRTALARTYVDQDRLLEAEELMLQVTNIDEAMLGKDPLRSLDWKNVLADIYYRQGRFQEAEVLLVEAIHSGEATIGPRHPRMQECTRKLAMTYSKQGKVEQLEALWKDAIRQNTAKLGADCLDTLESTARLADLYHEQDRWRDAVELEEKVVDAFKKLYGSQDDRTQKQILWPAWYQAHWANKSYEEDRWEEAVQLQTRSVEGYAMIHGLQHHDTVAATADLEAMKKSRASQAVHETMDRSESRNVSSGAATPSR